jgi:tripartite ATP-independent transporter DctM subunit
MEWWLVLLLLTGGMVLLLLSGLPIAIAFLLVDMVGVLVFMGSKGIGQMGLQIFSALSTFTLSPIPLFILMGELMFHSGVIYRTIDVLNQWLGRLPGRLSLLAAAAGTIFAALSGSTLANTAMLGTVLLPDMRRRGYKTPMSVGPIVGVGGLAMLIPPSSLAVVLASIGKISVGDILVAGVFPGLLLAALYGLYIVGRCWLDPSLAPSYEVERTSWRERIAAFAIHGLPLAFIIFMVLGLMLLGVATPTEAAASGVVATLLVVAAYGSLRWEVIRESLAGTVQISVMILMIIAASNTFSSLLAYSGATGGLVDVVTGFSVRPLLVLLAMQALVFLMGMFMETISIMMICLPIFMPIVKVLGFDPVWFGVLMLINFEMGLITPPFGMLLFVMKGVAPEETMEGICWAAFPFILCEMVAMAALIAWPALALWLPAHMG